MIALDYFCERQGGILTDVQPITLPSQLHFLFHKYHTYYVPDEKPKCLQLKNRFFSLIWEDDNLAGGKCQIPFIFQRRDLESHKIKPCGDVCRGEDHIGFSWRAGVVHRMNDYQDAKGSGRLTGKYLSE